MPLRLRLALWYGGLTGLMVALVSLFTYAVHSRVHYDDFDRVLAGAAEHVATEYAAASTPQEVSSILSAPATPGLTARVYDHWGAVVAAGANAAGMPAAEPGSILAQPSARPYDPLVGLAPTFVPGVDGRGGFGLVVEPGGGRWRLYALPLQPSGGYLVAGASLHDVDASVAVFRRLVPPLALLGAVVSFVVAGSLAGRALRPVATLTETATAIARSRRLSRRVPTSARRDELAQLGAAFNEMLDGLEQAFLAQQRFVGDASHELRAPLTAIQANLELLARQPSMPAREREEAVAEAVREARRLAQLVADLMALARADAGVGLRRRPVEFDRVALEAFAEARHLAHGQQLEIGEIRPTRVNGDPDRLKQLVLALLDNAIKYTPSGKLVSLELRRNGAAAEVVVRDEGVGISPEDLPHVFERFYRGDPARARDPGGTGLGLPIVRWIAEQHGGGVAVTSEPGRGTAATVRIPMLT